MVACTSATEMQPLGPSMMNVGGASSTSSTGAHDSESSIVEYATSSMCAPPRQPTAPRSGSLQQDHQRR